MTEIVRIENCYTAELELPAFKQLTEDKQRVVKAYPSRRLQRGVCSIPADYWSVIKDHSTVVAWLDNDMIRADEPVSVGGSTKVEGKVVETKPRQPVTKPKAKGPADIMTLAPAAAAQVVAAESDVTVLLGYMEKETRREVLQALEARVEVIEKENGKKV